MLSKAKTSHVDQRTPPRRFNAQQTRPPRVLDLLAGATPPQAFEAPSYTLAGSSLPSPLSLERQNRSAFAESSRWRPEDQELEAYLAASDGALPYPGPDDVYARDGNNDHFEDNLPSPIDEYLERRELRQKLKVPATMIPQNIGHASLPLQTSFGDGDGATNEADAGFDLAQGNALYEVEYDDATPGSTISQITRYRPTQFSRPSQSYLPVNPATAHIPLRPVTEIPERFRCFFKFKFFNAVQSQCLDQASFTLHSSADLVVSAPTGSGKTVILELAMIKALSEGSMDHAKIIYMAPTKALCSERSRDWQQKFSRLGLRCTELTGDTNFSSMAEIENSHVIVTTPEKWDSMTRRWKDHQRLMSMIRLFLIDEVHILNEKRGATLEAVVSRMKTMQGRLRIVALSATIPNINDVAQWISPQAKELVFGEEFRPIKLIKHVFSYPENGRNHFLYEKHLDFKLLGIITEQSNTKTTLIFCSTRKSAQSACDILMKESIKQGRKLWQTRNLNVAFKDKKLAEYATYGLAFHHAGVDFEDRKKVEKLYMDGSLKVVCTTSTLAVGVNLPAHLVIIKGTKGYSNGSFSEYSDLDILQMIGRAGRPGYDHSGVAVIMTTPSMQHRYRTLVMGTEILESSLHQHLMEHLNAEICLGTIRDVQGAIDWLKSTFLYIRIKRNPQHYNLGRQDKGTSQSSEKRLEGICVKDLALLSKHGIVTMEEAEDSEERQLKSTFLGEAMAKYYLKCGTMIKIAQLPEHASFREVLETITQAEEFKDCRFNSGEKTILNAMNKDPNIRFGVKGKVSAVEHKVFLMIQAVLSNIPFTDPKTGKAFGTMNMESVTVFILAARVARCIIDCLVERKDAPAFRNAMNVYRSIKARTWEDSPLILKQLEGIGPAMVKSLSAAGINSFEKLEATDARRIEYIVNRNPPFGNQIRDIVASLPKFTIQCQQVTSAVASPEIQIRADIGLANTNARCSKGNTMIWAVFWAESGHGDLLHFRRYPLYELQAPRTISFRVLIKHPNDAIICHLECEDYLGLDKQATIKADVDECQFIRLAVSGVAPESGLEEVNEMLEDASDPFEGHSAQSMTIFGSSIPAEEAEECETEITPMVSNVADLSDINSTRERCKHACKNKSTCAHECCKIGKRHPSKDFKLRKDQNRQSDNGRVATQNDMEGSSTTLKRGPFHCGQIHHQEDYEEDTSSSVNNNGRSMNAFSDANLNADEQLSSPDILERRKKRRRPLEELFQLSNLDNANPAYTAVQGEQTAGLTDTSTSTKQQNLFVYSNSDDLELESVSSPLSNTGDNHKDTRSGMAISVDKQDMAKNSLALASKGPEPPLAGLRRDQMSSSQREFLAWIEDCSSIANA